MLLVRCVRFAEGFGHTLGEAIVLVLSHYCLSDGPMISRLGTPASWEYEWKERIFLKASESYRYSGTLRENYSAFA